MSPKEIVSRMMEKDYFSQWLGIEVLEVEDGRCRLQMVVRSEMLNGFGIAHGGITYSLADSALAFASNSGGRQSLSIDTSINHLLKVGDGDVIEALAERISETDKLGHYEVKIKRQEQRVALFRGMVYRTPKIWE
jgi:acyl-CoA thioesterase